MIRIGSRPLWAWLCAITVVLASAAEAKDHDTPAGAPIETPRISPEQSIPVQWNTLARQLVLRDRPGESFQLFAALSLAQREALADPSLAKWGELASAEVSAWLLDVRLPGARGAERPEVSRLLEANEKSAGLTDRTELVHLVRPVAERAIARVRQMCAPALRPGLTDPGAVWTTAPQRKPVGTQIPALCPLGGELPRSPPPPRADSPEMKRALDAVREAVRARTAAQRATSHDWAAMGGGEETPAIWNAVADRLLTRDRADAKRAAEVMAALNLSMREAAIACFTEKYGYLTARPSQLDPRLQLGAPLPNFPSYPSAHACFSSAAAASLEAFFPKDAAMLDAVANEAAQSRVWAGLHYPFDGDEGLRLGRDACAHVLAR